MRGAELVLLASILVLALALVIRLYRPRSVLEPNAIVVLFVFHLAGQVLPASYFLLVDDLPAAPMYLRAAVVGALLIPLGGMLADLFLRPANGAVEGLYRRELVTDDATARAARVFLAVLGPLCGAIFLAYLARQETWPLYTLLYEQQPEIARAERLLATPSAHGYLFGFSTRYLMPLLFISIVANWRFLLNHWQRALAVAGVGMVFINNSYDGSKTLTALLFVLAFFYWLLLRTRGVASQTEEPADRSWWRRYAMPTVLSAGAFGYPLFIFLFLPAGRTQSFAYLVGTGVFGRLFWRPAENAYLAFEMFPQNFEFTRFLDISKVAWLFGAEHFDLSRAVAVFKYGQVMNAPPSNVGGLYAQFGWPAIIGGMLAFVVIVRGSEVVLTRMRVATPQVLALYTFVLFGAFRASWANLHAILFTEAILPSLIALFLWEVVRTRIARTEAGVAAPARAPARQRA